MSHSSLVRMGIGNGPSSQIPLLDDGPFVRKEAFDNWWDGIVFVDQAKNEFSRKDIVLTLANKEGGAHVDPSLDENYFNLRKHNTLGWFDHFPGGKVIPSADQVPAAMRQIGHEVLKTFVPNYILKFETAYSDRKKPGVFILGGSLVEGEKAPGIPSRNPVKSSPVNTAKRSRPGRNDQCDCGSGKKFKKCCGFMQSR